MSGYFGQLANYEDQEKANRGSIVSDPGYKGSSEYGSFSSTGSIQEKPKTESCVGAACKKLSNIGKKLKKRFTRKNRKKSYDSLLRGSFDSSEEIRYSDLDRGSFIEVGGRRKRRKSMKRKRHKHTGGTRCKCYSCCKKRGGKRRRTRKKRKSRKRRKKRKTRRRR